jgi:hypothetical protein
MFLLIMLFVFAIFAVELIGTSRTFDGAETQVLFSRTVAAFVTLFQIMTLDEWRGVVQPLCDRQPWVYLFFMFFIAIAALAMMNLVTAVVVESSVKRIHSDEDHKQMVSNKERKREKQGIQDLLSCFDISGG